MRKVLLESVDNGDKLSLARKRITCKIEEKLLIVIARWKTLKFTSSTTAGKDNNMKSHVLLMCVTTKVFPAPLSIQSSAAALKVTTAVG